MLDAETQADLARKAVDAFGRLDVEVVLVGSTSVLAAGLVGKASKDVDVLGPPRIPPARWESILRSAASALGAKLEERGWGVRSLVGRSGNQAWAVDVLIPETGPIPGPVASVVRKKARRTDLGLAAIPEHVMAMKAVAWGDCVGQGDEAAARVYEADLTDLGEALGSRIEWALVADLLKRYPKARADLGRSILHRTLGAQFGGEPDPDVA